jgi:hypothetical protein
MYCLQCGQEVKASARNCRYCGARVGVYAKPAPTVPEAIKRAETPDDAALSAAIARVLRRSSGAPLPVRLFWDLLRLVVALAAAAALWRSAIDRAAVSFEAVLMGRAAPIVRPLSAALIALVTTLVTFRVTSRRFTRPIRTM